MNEIDILQSIERVMAQVDYYLHCELYEEYARDRPDIAHLHLENAIRDELLRARAIALVSTIAEPHVR